MKIISKEPFVANGFFTLHNQAFLDNLRIAGQVVAKCLSHLEQRVKDKTQLTTKQLNDEVEQIILDNDCLITFKNYHSFPCGVCISVNKELVHGIPNDYSLQDGDVVSFDLGATYRGAIGDAARTFIYGAPKSEQYIKLVRSTKEALTAGIKAIAVGKQLGCIGDAIYKSAKSNGFNVIEKYGGHAISISKEGIGIPHAGPFVANRDGCNNGPRIQKGMVLAIEPMLLTGPTATSVLSDGWTVVTSDIGAHFEETIYTHEDHVEVITNPGQRYDF